MLTSAPRAAIARAFLLMYRATDIVSLWHRGGFVTFM